VFVNPPVVTRGVLAGDQPGEKKGKKMNRYVPTDSEVSPKLDSEDLPVCSFYWESVNRFLDQERGRRIMDGDND